MVRDMATVGITGRGLTMASGWCCHWCCYGYRCDATCSGLLQAAIALLPAAIALLQAAIALLQAAIALPQAAIALISTAADYNLTGETMRSARYALTWRKLLWFG